MPLLSSKEMKILKRIQDGGFNANNENDNEIGLILAKFKEEGFATGYSFVRTFHSASILLEGKEISLTKFGKEVLVKHL
jgi:hypothetical protein